MLRRYLPNYKQTTDLEWQLVLLVLLTHNLQLQSLLMPSAAAVLYVKSLFLYLKIITQPLSLWELLQLAALQVVCSLRKIYQQLMFAIV